jgi:fluoroquinolone resistance protein
MIRPCHEDRTFSVGELRPEDLAGAEFDRCVLRNGQWAGANLSKARFTECTFEHCDLSNVVVDGTGFRTTVFKECKLLGVRFDHCHDFLLHLRFEQCRLDLASFRALRMKGTRFAGCSLVEADLSGTVLANAEFNECDLAGAVFDGTDLTGADLSTARHFDIDPTSNRIKGARFALHGLPGLLTRYGIKVEP